MVRFWWSFWLAALGLARASAQDVGAEPFVARPAESTLELQVELHRRGFSCGSIDGVAGGQTEAALRAFQRGAGLTESGVLDRATRELLLLSAPALMEYVVAAEDLATLAPVPATWLEKSRATSLAHATLLELVGERFRASPRLLERLNPEVDWNAPMPGQRLRVPAVQLAALPRPPSAILIRLAARELQLVDEVGRVLAHFPVSIARRAEKRPLGELRVTVAIRDPNYTFDPEVFPESAEGRELGRKLIVPPGPNNPVGRAWIGLDRPGYGIHGTPDPEKVGRTESHGCFRLANWDALTVLSVVRVGMVVWIEE